MAYFIDHLQVGFWQSKSLWIPNLIQTLIWHKKRYHCNYAPTNNVHINQSCSAKPDLKDHSYIPSFKADKIITIAKSKGSIMEQIREHTSPTPKIGKIYRDNADNSFMILSMTQQNLLIEFADGRIKQLNQEDWEKSSPTPAVY